MHSAVGVQPSRWTGCPIRILRAPRSHAAPPERFAGLRVLHRPSAPRHPPRTLFRLSCVRSSFFVSPLRGACGACALLPSPRFPLLRSRAPLPLPLLALGKIEVIVIYFLQSSCKCACQEGPDKWKVENSQRVGSTLRHRQLLSTPDRLCPQAEARPGSGCFPGRGNSRAP